MSRTIEVQLESEGSFVIPAWVVDLDSFRRWADSDDYPQRGRISWFDGEMVIDMSPQEVDSHARVKRALYRYLDEFTEQTGIGEMLPDQTLFVHDESGVGHEPDAMVILWETLDSGRVTYREITAGSGRQIELAGSPDLTIEVVSRSSVRKDCVDLPEWYFAAGVREYWIIDARGGEVDFRLMTRGREEFVTVEPDADGYRASAVLGASFRIDRSENERGIGRYRLEHR